MNEKQQGIVEGIKLAAILEAQRIAFAAINQAVASKLIPAQNYNVDIKVEIEPRVIALAPGARLPQ